SPDGRFLVAVDTRPPGGYTRVWDWDRRLVVHEVAWRSIPGFSPDGRQMAIGYSDGSVRLYDLASSEEGKRCPAVLSPPGQVCFDPTGEKLAVWNDRSTYVPIVDLHTSQVTAKLTPPEGSPVTGFAWHPDGQTLATASGKLIYLWDLMRTAKPRLVLE